MKKLNKRKISTVDRFNQSPDKPFLSMFQTLMREKIIAIQEGTYSKSLMKKLIRNLFNQPENSINLDRDILLTCKVEPQIYLMAQDSLKKITGSFQPMDDVLFSLLTYLIRQAQNPQDQIPLFKKVPAQKSTPVLDKFEGMFKKYYKNGLSEIMDL